MTPKPLALARAFARREPHSSLQPTGYTQPSTVPETVAHLAKLPQRCATPCPFPFTNFKNARAAWLNASLGRIDQPDLYAGRFNAGATVWRDGQRTRGCARGGKANATPPASYFSALSLNSGAP